MVHNFALELLYNEKGDPEIRRKWNINRKILP